MREIIASPVTTIDGVVEKASHEGTYREASGAIRCSLRCNRSGDRALWWA